MTDPSTAPRPLPSPSPEGLRALVAKWNAWQSIDTAPLDRPIWIGLRQNGEPAKRLARWDADEKQWEGMTTYYQSAEVSVWAEIVPPELEAALLAATAQPEWPWPATVPDAADADLLSDLQAYVRHNAVLPSDHMGDGRVVPLSTLRGWIQRERQKLAVSRSPEPEPEK